MAFFAGLDLSYTGTGVVVVNGEGRVVLSREICTKPGHYLQRVLKLRSEILGALAGFDISLAMLEGYAMGAKQGREAAGELGFTIKLALAESGVEWLVVAPTALKKWTAGTGTARKEIMLREVWRRWGFEAATDNEGDACALAHLGRAIRMSDGADCEEALRAAKYGPLAAIRAVLAKCADQAGPVTKKVRKPRKARA